MEFYPLKLNPIFKSRIWGGERLAKVFGKDLPTGEKIGESWELADLEDDRSTIANGVFAGQTLREVISRYPKEVTGDEDFPKAFPLLIKFLDAQDVLSVQVHPDIETCKRMGRGNAKTECWYIISAEPGAVIYKGLKKGVTKEEFAKSIEQGSVAELLEKIEVRQGECHFLPAGTIHAIGAGLLIAEVQMPSDTTYRVFDWNRVDENDKSRPLHKAEAMESIHFEADDDLRVTTQGRIVDCEYFKIDKCDLDKGSGTFFKQGQMRVLIFISGTGSIGREEPKSVQYRSGDCIVIPACFEGPLSAYQNTTYLTVTI